MSEWYPILDSQTCDSRKEYVLDEGPLISCFEIPEDSMVFFTQVSISQGNEDNLITLSIKRSPVTFVMNQLLGDQPQNKEGNNFHRRYLITILQNENMRCK